jgi:hypothetical protein
MKRKMSRYSIDLEITSFLLSIPERQHQDAIEYIISQYVAVLADGSGKLQKEHITGLESFKQELANA